MHVFLSSFDAILFVIRKGQRNSLYVENSDAWLLEDEICELNSMVYLVMIYLPDA